MVASVMFFDYYLPSILHTKFDSIAALLTAFLHFHFCSIGQACGLLSLDVSFWILVVDDFSLPLWQDQKLIPPKRCSGRTRVCSIHISSTFHFRYIDVYRFLISWKPSDSW